MARNEKRKKGQNSNYRTQPKEYVMTETQKQAEKAKNNKVNQYSGVLVGVLIGLVVFSFSSGSINSKTKDWLETTATVTSAYEITEDQATEDQAAGYYADVTYEVLGEEVTQTADKLANDLTGQEGTEVEIKYNPSGEGCIILKNNSGTMSTKQIILIAVLVIFTFFLSQWLVSKAPTLEQYREWKAKRAAKKAGGSAK